MILLLCGAIFFSFYLSDVTLTANVLYLKPFDLVQKIFCKDSFFTFKSADDQNEQTNTLVIYYSLDVFFSFFTILT